MLRSESNRVRGCIDRCIRQKLPLIIVACRLADDRIWSEVMNCGGYDVLEKPFHQAELVRVVSMAWLAWKSQWQRSMDAGAALKTAGDL